MPRLGLTDAHCGALVAPTAVAGTGPPPVVPSPLADECPQGYVMLLSGHFQGFCRDLYTECAQLFAAAVPKPLRTTIQAQFAAKLELNIRNPTHDTIRNDFQRFGFLLALAAAPGNPQRIIHLAHLNYWRNHVAHQKATPPPAAVLASTLDDIMQQELARILGAAPW